MSSRTSTQARAGIRLVTFDRLSLLGRLSRPVAHAVADISSHSVTFDTHVLQDTNPAEPLDSIANPRQQKQVCEWLHNLSAQFVSLTMGLHPLDGPIGFEHVAEHTKNAGDIVLRLQQFLEQPVSPGQWQWIHLSTAPESTMDTVIAELLRTLTRSNLTGGTVQIVTALRGALRKPNDRFESILTEERLRVPLWIQSATIHKGRCANLTGSHDIMETIDHILSSDNAVSHPSLDSPQDLMEFADGTTPVEDRLIRVRHDSGRACRTGDFLFVRAPSIDAEEKIGLYRKPEDVWNVHNVSHEYPDVVDEMIVQMRKNR